MESGLTGFVVPSLIGAIIAGPLVGWVTSLRVLPIRFFAVHPWLVVWIGGVLLTGSVQLFVLSPAAGPFSIAALPMYLSLLVVELAAVQGLRISWLRSRLKGTLIWLGLLLYTAVETVAIPRSAEDFYSHVFAAISFAPSLALAAWIAQRVGRRFAVTHVPYTSPRTVA